MTLIARAARLFKADLHAVLDRVEEPDLVLQQAIREMEEDLAQDRRRLETVRTQERQIADRDGEVERSLTGIAEELDVCFAAGKEDLCRALLRRRLEAERLRAGLAHQRAGVQERLERLAKRVDEHGSQLEAMRQKAELLAPSPPSRTGEPSVGAPWEVADVRIRDEEVEVAFLREQTRRARS